MSVEEDMQLMGWIPIEKMRTHVHGLYLCLIKSKDRHNRLVDNYHVEQRYFTYNDNQEAAFQDLKDAEGVVAFMTPRYYPHFGDAREKKTQRELRHLREEMAQLKKKYGVTK